MKLFLSLVIVLAWLPSWAANVTNLYAGQAVYAGMALTTVPSSDAVAWNPTNQWSNNIIAWYPADTYYTNAGIAIWPDYQVNHYNLTNTSSGLFPIGVANALNGHQVLRFTNSLLRTPTIPTIPANAGYMFVFRYDQTNGGTAQERVTYNADASGVIQAAVTTHNYNAFGGAAASSFNEIISKWIILECVNWSGNSYIYTNIVEVGHSPGVGLSLNTAIGLGGRYSDGGAPMPFTLASWLIYTNSTDTVMRSNLFWGMTNQFNISP